MTEWWTYRFSDFLMFEPETYYRLFERLNAALWPLGLVALLIGLWMLALSWRGRSRARVAALLAIVWCLVAYVFHYRLYSTIMLAGNRFGQLFVLEGLLLGGWAYLARQAEDGRPWRGGVYLAGIGMALWPFIAPLTGRNWKGAELFGLAPDPTAVVTIGLLLAIRAPKGLLILPGLWCLISAATLYAIHSVSG